MGTRELARSHALRGSGRRGAPRQAADAERQSRGFQRGALEPGELWVLSQFMGTIKRSALGLGLPPSILRIRAFTLLTE
jgi:hypothetical protein